MQVICIEGDILTLKIHTVKNEHLDFLSDHSSHIQLEIVENPNALLSLTGQNILLTIDLVLTHARQVMSNKSNNYIMYIPREGTSTIENLFEHLKWDNIIRRPFIISSGDFGNNDHINIDAFRVIFGGKNPSQDHLEEQTLKNIFIKKEKPYVFNFLNGVERKHRTLLHYYLENKQLLNFSLWSYLSKNEFLPSDYQFEFIPDNFRDGQCIKNGWPAGILYPSIFEDTYFSLVTETNFQYPYGYRTEKTYKPLRFGHPFIIVSNCGFYKSLHNLGFKTFGNLIDETFDNIEDDEKRLLRISEVVNDLVNSDLVSFLDSAKEICKHNREVMIDTLTFGNNTAKLDEFLNKFDNYAKAIK